MWADADEPGAKAMTASAANIREAEAVSIAMVALPDGLPEGWDGADPVPDGIDQHELLRSARPVGDASSGEDDVGDETELRRLAALSPVEYDR